MASLKNKTHLFFDLDDTLWDFEKNSALVLRDLFEEFELSAKIKSGFDDFYQSYKRINQQLWNSYRQQQIGKEQLRNSRFDLAFKAFDHHNLNESRLLNEQYLLRAPHGKALKEDCLEVLAYLKNNYQLHIITNGFKEVQHIKIDGCGLRDFFAQVIVSEEHALTKPDEKIFRIAESLSGAKPEHCVMIGDNFECDVMGALAAGWEAVYFSETPGDYKGHSINRLSALKELF